MEQPAIRILNAHRIMSISTVRADGWPQTTIVGYANKGWDIFFMIFRSGQKFANIERDNRISIAVGAEPSEMKQLQAVYGAANASEITDPAERAEVWRQLMQRHSNLAGFQMPGADEAAMMRARLKYVSVLDYTQGPGHREQLIIGADGVPIETELQPDEWGTSSGTA
jgi:nitroimidazol reductase NimA-like FMN-containing flavoprotein (pyridoxamine 5'-phosphate oxidase superfamily)